MRDLSNLDRAVIRETVEAWAADWINADYQGEPCEPEVVSAVGEPEKAVFELQRALHERGYEIREIEA
jgi:hypothetical protein